MQASLRYLIELGPAFLPETLYLHVFDGAGDDPELSGPTWLPDRNRALRFASREEAERFGHAQLDCAFIASAHLADELVAVADHVSLGGGDDRAT